MAETEFDEKELEDLKRKILEKYNEYPKYKVPFLSAEERTKLGKFEITDEEFNIAFDKSMEVYRDKHITPGIPILASTEMLVQAEESNVGYVVGREDNNAIVVCKGSGLSSLSSLFGASLFESDVSKEEWSVFERLCNDKSSSNIMRLGICGYECNDGTDNNFIFIHHFRPILPLITFID